jgi:hypothetical protein
VICETELHTYARAYAAERVLDKKQLRWNGIVAVGVHYARCGNSADIEIAKAGIRDAVDACTIGNSMHIPGGSVLTMIQLWMEPRT